LNAAIRPLIAGPVVGTPGGPHAPQRQQTVRRHAADLDRRRAAAPIGLEVDAFTGADKPASPASPGLCKTFSYIR